MGRVQVSVQDYPLGGACHRPAPHVHSKASGRGSGAVYGK